MIHKHSDEVKQDKSGVNTFNDSPHWLDRSIRTVILSSGQSDSVSSRESNPREKQRAFPGLDI